MSRDYRVDTRKAAFSRDRLVAFPYGRVAHVEANPFGTREDEVTTLCGRTTKPYFAGGLRLCEECWTAHIKAEADR